MCFVELLRNFLFYFESNRRLLEESDYYGFDIGRFLVVLGIIDCRCVDDGRRVLGRYRK